MLSRSFYPTQFRPGTRAWTPFGELRQIQNEMDRLFSRTFPRSAEQPPINVWSNEDETIVQAEMPGYDAEKIDISVQQNTLTLRAERQPVELKTGETYHRRERQSGRVVRTVELPFEVDNDKVEAQYSAGILSVRLPRAEANKPRKIAIKAS
jgi:HSP20 family protein